LLRGLADEGRTVFLSSHLMSEMAVTADHIIVIGRGRLLRDMPTRQLIAETIQTSVRVRTTEPAQLAALLEAPQVTIRPTGGDELVVEGLTTDAIGLTAAQAAIPILELTGIEASLEEAYMALTEDQLEFGTR
jgi:ABC-2 type transport system ATP-binding protein